MAIKIIAATNVAKPTPKPPEVVNLPPPCVTPKQVDDLGIEMVGMDGLAPAAETKPGKYPILPDPQQQFSSIAAQIRLDVDKFEEIEGRLKKNKALLNAAAMSFYFLVNHGKAENEIPSSIRVNSPEGGVLVTFQDRFKDGADTSAVKNIVGKDILSQYFRQEWELVIDGDKMPAGEVSQKVLNEVKAIFAKYNLTDALTFTSKVKPRKGFQQARHRLLSPDANLKLHVAMPCIPMVKVKGVA